MKRRVDRAPRPASPAAEALSWRLDNGDAAAPGQAPRAGGKGLSVPAHALRGDITPAIDRLNSATLPVQRIPGGGAATAPPARKVGAAGALNRLVGWDPGIAKSPAPDVPWDEARARMEVVAKAVAKERAVKEMYIRRQMRGGMSREQAEEKAVKEGVGDHFLVAIPAEYRPRRVSPEEKQIKRNEQAFLNERLAGRWQEHQARVAKSETTPGIKSTMIKDLKARQTYARTRSAPDTDEGKLSAELIAGYQEARAPLQARVGSELKLKIKTALKDKLSKSVTQKNLDLATHVMEGGELPPGLMGTGITEYRDIAKAEDDVVLDATDLSRLTAHLKPTLADSTEVKDVTSAASTVAGSGEVQDPTRIDMLVADFAPLKDTGGIASTVSDALSLSQGITRFIQGPAMMFGGDRAQGELGLDYLINSVFALGNTVINLGKDATILAADFASGIGGSLMHWVPGFGIASGALKVTQSGIEVARHAYRMIGQRFDIRAAGTTNNKVLKTAIQSLFMRGIQLVTHKSVKILANSLVILGDALHFGGPFTAPIGAGVKAVGILLELSNVVSQKIIDSYRAGRTQATRLDWMLAEEGSAEDLLQFDPKHVAQTIILLARDGDPNALKTLNRYGIRQRDLATTPDDHIRELIVRKMEDSQDPKNITQTLLGAATKFKEGVGGKYSAYQEARQLANVKNELAYGAKANRGSKWAVQQAFIGDVKQQWANIATVVERDTVLNDTEKEKLLMGTPIGRSAGPEVSGPLQAMSRSELQALLNRPLDEVTRALVQDLLSSKYSTAPWSAARPNRSAGSGPSLAIARPSRRTPPPVPPRGRGGGT